MSEELLEEYTRQYIEAQALPEAIFAWQGGEPTLMGLDFFRKALELQRKYCRPGMTIRNTLQTNGTLLSDEWGQFLRAHDFLVGISLDGPRALHDAYRVDKGGQGTFDRVMSGLEILKRHRVNYNLLTCVHSANAAHPLEVYRFLRDEVKAQFIQFIPIVERSHKTGHQENIRATPRSVSAKQYGAFLIAIFDEWVRNDVGQVYVQIFDAALEAWYQGHASLCIFAEACGLAVAIEHTGDVYTCDHFVESRYRLGNIMKEHICEMVTSEKQERFGQAKRETLPRICRQCTVRFACNGGCPKDRFLKTPTGAPGLNYLCEGYKAFFTHIAPAMKIMTSLLHQQRPPAEIMELLAADPALI